MSLNENNVSSEKMRKTQEIEDAEWLEACGHNDYVEYKVVNYPEVTVIDDDDSDKESTSYEDAEWQEASCHNTSEKHSAVGGVSEVIVINDEHSDNESSSQEDELQQDRTASIKLCSLTVAEKLIIKQNMRYVIDKLFQGYAVIKREHWSEIIQRQVRRTRVGRDTLSLLNIIIPVNESLYKCLQVADFPEANNWLYEILDDRLEEKDDLLTALEKLFLHALFECVILDVLYRLNKAQREAVKTNCLADGSNDNQFFQIHLV
jgi:hypothetical protein